MALEPLSFVEQLLKEAPVAIMDTRASLGLCALTEEDFPALYALQGHRVALIDLGPDQPCEGDVLGQSNEEMANEKVSGAGTAPMDCRVGARRET